MYKLAIAILCPRKKQSLTNMKLEIVYPRINKSLQNHFVIDVIFKKTFLIYFKQFTEIKW